MDITYYTNKSSSYDTNIGVDIMKLIQIALKYCKKVVCILLIILMMFNTAGFAANENKYKIDEPTKIELLNKAEIVQWNEFNKIMSFGSRFIVIDYYTGSYFVCERHMGGLHADIETIDKEATKSLRSVYKDRENWKHRPVLVVMEDGRVYAASSFVLDHAGRDDKPFLKVVDDRSRGYGRGENYDKIKNNGMEGHICVHVRGAKNHFDGKESKEHQSNIDYLEKEKNK